MTRLTDSEWNVMEVLWAGDGLQLAQIVEALAPEAQWRRNTVHTYLTRMMGKGLVRTDDNYPHRYYANINREQCAEGQRNDFLERVYQGSAGRLVMSFVKDGSLTREERDELRKLLDEMEV